MGYNSIKSEYEYWHHDNAMMVISVSAFTPALYVMLINFIYSGYLTKWL